MRPMLNRAYSLVTLKAADGDRRVLTGMATTPEPDRVGDVVEPVGVTFKNPLPLLLFHDSRLPVGHATFGRATEAGIAFQATLADPGDSEVLKARIDEAWASVKAGLIKGVSIGFRVLEDGIELMKSGGYRFTKTEVLEMSLVTIPANASAVIETIKSIDAPYLAASGNGLSTETETTPGVAGTPAVRRPGHTMKTIAEQITSYKSTRDVKFQERQGMMSKAADEGRTLDANESEVYDTLETEVKGLDLHIKRLELMQTEQAAAAVPVVGLNPTEGHASRVSSVIHVRDNVPPGMGFTRFAIAKIMAATTGCSVQEYAKARWPDYSPLHAYIQKATIPAGLTTDANWAGNLVDPTNLASEFLEYLRPLTLVGRIPGLRRVPFNVRVTGQATGAVANWVGQGKPKPVTSFSTNVTTLTWAKIAAIAVISEELARFSSPSAEALVRDELARAVIERMDIDFIDPAQAAVANVSPASITNGVTALTPSGTNEAAVRADLITLLTTFIENNMDPRGLVLIMPNSLALCVSLMVNSLGQTSFTGIGVEGGSLLGITVVASQYAANQSGAGNLVIALKASDIFIADDGQVTLDASREASIQMSDAPTNDASTGTGQSLVSMYQTNSIALRAERFINWAKARTTAVVYMDDVNWGSVGSP